MSLTVRGGKLSINGRAVDAKSVSDLLAEFLVQGRIERIEDVLAGRTLNVATVVEGSINTGNVSAVMRTAEAFGFLPFHVIRTDRQFKNSARTSQGSDKWLDLKYWDDPESCLNRLKETGYQVIATVPDTNATPISAHDFSQPTAIVFGNEAEGISPFVRSAADSINTIPMTGFVESFNISVAGALCLYQAFVNRGGTGSGDLTLDDLEVWRAMYYYRSVRGAEQIVESRL